MRMLIQDDSTPLPMDMQITHAHMLKKWLPPSVLSKFVDEIG